MAPRKNLKTANNAPQKTPRSRPKAAKPKLDSPIETEPEIPRSRQSSGVCVAPVKLTRQLTAQRKLDLANEVARAQLVKDAPVIIEPEVTPAGKMKISRKKGQEPIVSAFFDNADVKKTPRRRLTKKLSTDSEVVPKKPTVSRKTIADSTQKTTTPRGTRAKPGTRNNAKTNPSICNGIVSRILRNRKKIETAEGKETIIEPDCSHSESVPVLTDLSLGNTENSAKKPASSVDSRKASMASSASSLSWTKDISSSSTATCVTVTTNDVVRIDNKLPVIQLHNVDNEVNKLKCNDNDCSSSDSDSSSSSSSENHSDVINNKPKSLNIGASSDTTKQNIISPKNATIMDDLIIALDKLSLKLKNYDLEIINWIGYDGTYSEGILMQKFEDEMFKVLKEESDVIKHCRHLKEILSDEPNICEQVDKKSPSRTCDQTDSVIPTSIYCRNNSDEFEEYDKFTSEDSKHTMFSQNVATTPVLKDLSEKSDDSDHLSSDHVGYGMSFEHNDDDDDALSLFAESLTGLESSRCNNSIASMSNVDVVTEEYVPQPLSMQNLTQKLIYRPSKLQESPNENLVKKAICEKQTADSTSINKESEYSDHISKTDFDQFGSDNQQANANVVQDGLAKTVPIEKNSGKGLMAMKFITMQAVKSVVFRGFCFFHLVKSCKNPRCHFPHKVPDINEIRNRLAKLREDLFIMEYMLLRSWPSLRRMYGLFYVQECSRRELTRILVEMGIDFVSKANPNLRDDALLQTEVLELILLYLNNADLNVCHDLLDYHVVPQTRLCDVLMKTLANTQNFSRFKRVFCKLTNFIVQNKRTFELVVAEQILERVCILPYDKELIQAVLNIIKNTDGVLFQNTIMSLFEKKLATSNRELSEELLSVKNKSYVGQALVQRVFDAPAQTSAEAGPPAGSAVLHLEREKRYTSPDTTNIDYSKIPPVEPIITRTINQVSLNQSYNRASPLNGSVEEWPKPKFVQTWRYKTPRTVPTPLPATHMNRPQMRPLKRQGQRQVTYGVPPAKYPRRLLQNF